jgi:hypothetical protein
MKLLTSLMQWMRAMWTQDLSPAMQPVPVRSRRR